MSGGKLRVTLQGGSVTALSSSEKYFVVCTFPEGATSSKSMETKAEKDIGAWNKMALVEFNKQITNDMCFTFTLIEHHAFGPNKPVGEGVFRCDELLAAGAQLTTTVHLAQAAGAAKTLCDVSLDLSWDGTVPDYIQNNQGSGGTTTTGGGATAPSLGPGGATVGGGASGGSGGAARIGAAAAMPNPEGRSYSVRVMVRKAKNLQSENDNQLFDPLVCVSIGNETQKTDYQKKTNEPIFDDELMFMVNADQHFWSLPIRATVMHHRIGLPDDEIGGTQLEMQAVYKSQNHMMAHKWFLLRRGGLSTQIMGFLKMTIMVLDALTDQIPEMEDDEEDGEESEDALIRNLVNTPGAQFEEVYLKAEMYRAHGIPQMDGALSGGKADPFVKLSYGMKMTRTSHIRTTLLPEWNTVVMLPIQKPALIDSLLIQMFDYDGLGKDKIIGTARLSIEEMKALDGETVNKSEEGLPRHHARFINFYGCPRGFYKDGILSGLSVAKPNFYHAMDKGLKEGVDFRGRLLCRFTGSRDKGCEKDPLSPQPKTALLHYTIALQGLQFSMLRKGRYTFTLSCGNGEEHPVAVCKTAKDTTEMRGTSTGLGAIFFGEEIRLEQAIEVVIPSVTVDYPNKFRAFVESQIPDVFVHLFYEKNMYAVYRVKASDILSKSEASSFCGAMNVLKDPEKNDEGEAPSDPLAQFTIGMILRKVEPSAKTLKLKDSRDAKDQEEYKEQALTEAERALLPTKDSVAMPGIPQNEPQKFAVEACIHRGVNFPVGDPNGLSDPFVRVSFANASAQTGVQLETLNPTFEELVLVRADARQPFTNIIVELWDWDLIGSNSFLAKAVVDYRLGTEKAGEKVWLTGFTDHRGKSVEARLLCSFEIRKDVGQTYAQRTFKKKSGAQNKDTYTGYEIPAKKKLELAPHSITISCLNLRKMRPFRMLDVKNAQVQIAIGNTVIDFEKKKGLNPDINQTKTVVLELPKNPEYWPNLAVAVFDHRNFASKPRVGVASVRLTAKATSPCRTASLSQRDADREKKDKKLSSTKRGAHTRKSNTAEAGDLTVNEFDDEVEMEDSANELDEADFALQQVKDTMERQFVDKNDQRQDDEKANKENSVKNPSDIPWFERFDADDTIADAGFAVARLGKVHDYLCKADKVKTFQGANEATAEAYFGPFADDGVRVPLLRGFSKKSSKAGDATLDISIERAPAGTKLSEESAPAELVPTNMQNRLPAKYELRAYLISCRHLAAVDHSMSGSSSDPYLVLTLDSGVDGEKAEKGKKLNLKEFRKDKTLNPDYYLVQNMQGELPKQTNLLVEVYDYNDILSDKLIGFTNINLEDRWYSCRGYTAHRPHMEPGMYTEKRQLRDKSGQIQGTVELWIDMFPTSSIPHPIDITPPPPIEMELRTIVWSARDVVLEDMSLSGEPMVDIYVRAWMNGLRHDMQSTDVHYRSLDGSGTFNWRMNFQFMFDPRSKKIMPMSKKASSIAKWFRIRREQKKFDPIVKLQIFDNNLLPGTDNFIGEASLHLMKLRPVANTRDKGSLLMEMLGDMKDVVTSFLCCKCCQRKPTLKDLSLEQRQAMAVKEFENDCAARDAGFKEEADERVSKLRALNTFSETQLQQFHAKFMQEARAKAQINAFETFLPSKNKKKSTSKNLKDVQELPPQSETAKYWFAARGPTGSGRVGDVQVSFQLVRLEAMAKDDKLAAGRGRAEPQALPDPNRPDTSYFWLTSPFKAATHILWKRFKWYIIGLLVFLLLAAFIYVFLTTGVRTQAEEFFK
ncbi:Hypothetical protein, putative [Bodo saltans]|uniref:C2 domain-containing protein n=1 Tax=Bodo saltans TaxID=75058 RepID=A0A0S4IS20_BODSA|nr:Hypothetical protein, putative [Bodo saltans]|eukprot:CUF53784.1 Hypothetical protein, putative [Bodo saltans]